MLCCTTGSARPQNGHWKSLKSTTETFAEAFPIMGATARLMSYRFAGAAGPPAAWVGAAGSLIPLRAATICWSVWPDFTAATTDAAIPGLLGHDLSSTRHWAMDMPHGQAHLLPFMIWSARSFWTESRPDRSTPDRPSR